MPAGLTDAAPPAARTATHTGHSWFLLIAVSVAGLMVRAIPVVVADFPVNDGGLFVAMTRAIMDAGWALPATVAWNGTDLPFIYPPGGFYLAGALDAVPGVDLLAVFRWLPLFASSLVVPAVYLLAREVLRSDGAAPSAVAALAAALAYALAPASWVWLIQGGGVTRAAGMLLAVLTLWLLVRLVRSPNRRGVVAVGVLAGLTALVHPGAAVFAAVSGVLIWVFEGRSRTSLRAAAGSASVALLVVAPWLLVVLPRVGIAALLEVPSNGPDPAAAALALLAGRYTGLPFIDPLAVVALAVAILQVVRRRFLLPLWLLAGLALSYQYAMVPFGLLIGVAVMDLAAFRRQMADTPTTARRATAVMGVLLGLAFVFVGAASVATVRNPGAPVHALSPERREAMARLADLQPARVAVITDSVWNSDADSEWFPLLTASVSVATVQGSELRGRSAFQAQVEAHDALQGCVRPASVSCVEAWLADHAGELLYLPKGPLHGPSSPDDCCADLREALRADARSACPGFLILYDSAGATILIVADLVRPPVAGCQ